jgi:formylglycine-generating enzyme
MPNILEIDNTNMVFVKGSPFKMRENHEVTLSDYHIGQFPVTQKLWMFVMNGENPSNNSIGGENYPIVNVSWNDIVENFLPKLNKKIIESSSGYSDFRLPTEAEWEYAARGGRVYSNKDSDYVANNQENNVVNFNNTSTKPVGLNKKNELEIHDIFENVWEWCVDDWNQDLTKIPKDTNGQYRVFRGGPYFTLRNYCEPMLRNPLLGVRLVCTKLMK